MVDITTLELPRFGVEPHLPPLPLEEYRTRLDQAVARLADLGLDVLVVYADREHSANLEFLTGFDPRFEEAVLLLDRAGRRLLLVGNECMGYLPDDRLEIPVTLFQEFSLLGQQRGQSSPLGDLLRAFGIAPGTRVGCAGWKYFTSDLVGMPETALEIPAYLADLLRHLTGDRARVRNATSIFMNPEDGLRVTSSASQIARFEYAAIRASEGIRAAVEALQPGVEEQALERHFYPAGLPLSCHSMVSFGDKARRGLSSPSERTAALGDTFTMALGLKGALSCRAGAIAHGPADLSPEVRDFYAALASNYFAVVATWYEHVKVGAVAGDVFAAVSAQRDPALYTFAVNPGHYIHLDEWLHSPFSAGSSTVLRSGAALQMDIIPVSAGSFCYINAEDGIALADEALRSKLAARFPAMWARIQARREFMREGLGIRIDESVLPLSNTAGWLAPYGLAPTRVFVQRAR